MEIRESIGPIWMMSVFRPIARSPTSSWKSCVWTVVNRIEPDIAKALSVMPCGGMPFARRKKDTLSCLGLNGLMEDISIHNSPRRSITPYSRDRYPEVVMVFLQNQCSLRRIWSYTKTNNDKNALERNSRGPPRRRDTKMHMGWSAAAICDAVVCVMRPEGRGLQGLLCLSSSMERDWLSILRRMMWMRTHSVLKMAFDRQNEGATMNAKVNCGGFVSCTN